MYERHKRQYLTDSVTYDPVYGREITYNTASLVRLIELFNKNNQD